MSTRPAQLPEWNTSGANNVEPLSGSKASGWGLNQTPASSTFTWWMRKVWEWTVHFADGVWDQDIELDGKLTIAPSVPGFPPVLDVTGNAAIDGSALITGNLDVDGDVEADGDVKYGAARSKVLNPSDGAYTTSGTGKILGLTDAIPQTGGSGAWECTTTSGGFASCRQHMNLESGSRVAQIKARFEKTSGGDPTIQVSIYNASSGVHTSHQIFTTADFGALIVGNNNVTCTLASPITLADGEDVSVSLVVPAVGDKLRAVQPYWSRP